MNRKRYMIAGIILIVIIGIFLILSPKQEELDNSNKLSSSDISDSSDNVREISLDAKMFEFSQTEIRVKQGERIRISINNMDATHGIWIPGLGVSGNEKVEFTADKKGEFEFSCNNYCGAGHRDMKGVIIVG